ncbi:MAG TPA: hypothetical protein VGD88_16205 [Opitutaceae bacterium]
MLFAQKTKGYFVDFGDNVVTLARTSSSVAPLTIEQVIEVPAGNDAALEDAIRQIQPKKSPSGYLHATVGVYPLKRLVRRAALELKRVKEPAYLAEVASTQFRIEAEKYSLAVLNSADGSDFDVNRAAQKEVLFCGLSNDDIVETQDRLLAHGIYPERLELGTVGALGALVSFLAAAKSKTPTLVLEIGMDSTHSFIVTGEGIETSRPIPQGLDSMIPVVQKELNLKDEESARKLFFSNTFDFTGMGPALIRKLLKELQSSIGFYEVQTGQSIGQVCCLLLPSKLAWLEGSIAAQLGVGQLGFEFAPWLQVRGITVPETGLTVDARLLGLLGLMAHYHAVLPEKK